MVWQGRKPGIYIDWDACKVQVQAVQGAQYKAFDSIAEAASKLPYSSSVVTQNTRSIQSNQNNQILVIDENGITVVKHGTETPPVLDA